MTICGTTDSSSATKISNFSLLLSSIVLGIFTVLISYCFVIFDIDRAQFHLPDLSTLSSALWVASCWSAAQWIPLRIYDGQWMNEVAWKFWEGDDGFSHANRSDYKEEDIPVVYVQDHTVDELLPYLEHLYGKDWRKRPLLLKGLWNTNDLSTSSSKSRRLSLPGLLQETMTVPYFTDARRIGALSPDGVATIKDIVSNISLHGAPHKIATQLLLQKYPELIREVAPLPIVTQLFGPYFSSNAIRGSGPFLLFPALTTVPLFVANSHAASATDKRGPISISTDDDTNMEEGVRPPAHTALHCEPIGNVAVQLSGQKQWTLVRPEFSNRLRPSIAPDGRAFFASWLSSWPMSSKEPKKSIVVPFYHAVTDAGDAIWVPTWTWHRVDYVSTHEATISLDNVTSNADSSSLHSIAIGASLFHFRPVDFVVNNPLYAVLILPAILLELIGYNTQ
jgi:Cupin-like domain